MKKLIRDCISKIEPYEPGKPVEILRRELNLKGKIHKLASNENPLGPSPRAVAAIRESLDEGHLYPDNSCHNLKERLAVHLSIPPENIAVGNGTTELIFLMGMAFLNPGETYIMSQSSFIMGKIVAQIMDSRLVEVPLKKDHHDLEAILSQVNDETKIVYLDNPMNPVGTIMTQEEVMRFMERIPRDVIVAFDEAYFEYVNRDDFPNTLTLVEEGRNVIVFRTFSKLYGLAGLRVGYCVAKGDLIQAIQHVCPPFAVNRYAQAGATAALDDQPHKEKTKMITASGKKFLYEHFDRMSVSYIPSETNFVTIDLKTDARIVTERLQKKNVIVRPLTMYGKPTFLRVTIGTLEQNKQFLEAFRQIYPQSC